MPEGQEKDIENGVAFDSANIGKKKKATQFTIIEGAEERARAAQIAKVAAEREAQELHQADIEAASLRQKQAEEAERQARGGIAYKLFGGWRKWLWLAILLIAIAATVYFVFFNKKPEVKKSAKEEAKALYDEQLAKIDRNNLEESYVSARDLMEEKWNSADDDESKFWYGYYYAYFMRDSIYDEQAAYNILSSLEVPEGARENGKCELAKAEYSFSSYGLDFGIGPQNWEGCL